VFAPAVPHSTAAVSTQRPTTAPPVNPLRTSSPVKPPIPAAASTLRPPAQAEAKPPAQPAPSATSPQVHPALPPPTAPVHPAPTVKPALATTPQP
jgi:hypothetical protein